MKFPRVLIFGQSFNLSSGGGITLSNLFKGWDKNKLAVTNIGNMMRESNSDICSNYYLLGSEEHRWVFPLNKFHRKYPSGSMIIDQIDNHITPRKSKSFKETFLYHVFYPFTKYIGIFHTLSSINLSENFINWVLDFKPEILYVQISTREEINFAQKLQSLLKIPMIIHMMDDWPSTISEKGIFKKYWKKAINSDLQRLFTQSSLLFSISDYMSREYKVRYKRDFISFHNPIDTDFWQKSQRNHYNINKTPTLLYAGRTGVGINSSLEQVCKAIEILSKNKITDINFIIQTNEKLQWFDNYKFITYRSFVNYSDLPAIFSNADFLLLSNDFSDNSINFLKYSMPTKISEYMISGTPIIVFSPKETAIAQYTLQNQCGYVITENSTHALMDGLQNLISDKALRQQLGTKAKEIALKTFNSKDVFEKFSGKIRDLIVYNDK